jgi:acetyltransferase-like isoleucine patch superfamily enzyme/acyl carrier protein
MTDREPEYSRVHQVVRRAALAFARTTLPLRMRHIDSVGRGARIQGRPYIENSGHIRIGDHFRMWCRPIRSHLVARCGGVITIGNDVTIGSGAAIAAEARIEIRNDVSIGPGVMIMDTDFHDVRQHGRASSTAPVIIEDGVRIGWNVTILKGTQVKCGSRVIDGSVIAGIVEAGVSTSGIHRRIADVPRRSPAGRREHADIFTDVSAVVRRTFAWSHDIQPEDGPAQIAGWDSLGSLRLLLALEEEFQITFPDEGLSRVEDVAQLCSAVSVAVAHGQEGWGSPASTTDGDR